MCEVNFTDFSLPLDSDTDSENDVSEQFSMYSSDTGFESDINVVCETENFNDIVDKKHRRLYCDVACYTVVVSIKDRHADSNGGVGNNLVISYKHDINRHQNLKWYCYEVKEKKNNDQYFSGIFYPPTRCYVHWPGQLLKEADHNSLSPFYCVHNWTDLTSAPLKKEKFYTLFCVKKRYHKLFTPNSQWLFYCAPSDQSNCVDVDSSSLFPHKDRTYPIRLKYEFLSAAKQSDKCDETCSTESVTDNIELQSKSEDISEAESDDTVFYDYEETDMFFTKLTKMHRTENKQDSDVMKRLMSSKLEDIIDNPALNLELQNCKSDGDWRHRIVKPERFSVRTRPLVVSNEVQRKELQCAYNNVESLKMQTVMKLNKCYGLLTGLCEDYFKLSKESDSLMDELNARNSFAFVTNTGLKLNHQMKFKATKLEDKISEKNVSIIKEENNVNNGVVDGALPQAGKSNSTEETKMEVSECEMCDDTDLSVAHSDMDDSKFCKRYVDKRSFECHIKSHTGKKYSCSQCSKNNFKNIMSYKRNLNFHKRGDNYLMCNQFPEKFEQIYQLTSHKKRHEEAKLPCTVDENCKKK